MKAKNGINVFFFGDSVCSGQGVALHKGWVTRISASLCRMGERYGKDVVVINASVNGNTTRQALERMPYDVQSHGVDIIIIQFGLNDCNFWESDHGHPRVSPEAFRANLNEIIQRAFTFGAQSVFLNTNHPTGRYQVISHTEASYESYNIAYNKVIRSVCHSRPKVILNDIEAAFDQATNGDKERLSSLLLPDMLHLSETGHDLYFEIVHPPVYAEVERILKDHG
jgi:acyl-CoA thioesterase-1